ncbi:MAG: hypothetical protein KDB39_15750, partial [Austwickia sp.]|nr:hypothetical protein [Austwickia sp.]
MQGRDLAPGLGELDLFGVRFGLGDGQVREQRVLVVVHLLQDIHVVGQVLGLVGVEDGGEALQAGSLVGLPSDVVADVGVAGLLGLDRLDPGEAVGLLLLRLGQVGVDGDLAVLGGLRLGLGAGQRSLGRGDVLLGPLQRQHGGLSGGREVSQFRAGGVQLTGNAVPLGVDVVRRRGPAQRSGRDDSHAQGRHPGRA